MASTWAFTIGGVDKKATVGKRSLTFDMIRGNRGVMSALIVDKAWDATAYRPALDAETILTIDSVARFGGFILNTHDGLLGGVNCGTGTLLKVARQEIGG